MAAPSRRASESTYGLCSLGRPPSSLRITTRPNHALHVARCIVLTNGGGQVCTVHHRHAMASALPLSLPRSSHLSSLESYNRCRAHRQTLTHHHMLSAPVRTAQGKPPLNHQTHTMPSYLLREDVLHIIHTRHAVLLRDSEVQPTLHPTTQPCTKPQSPHIGSSHQCGFASKQIIRSAASIISSHGPLRVAWASISMSAEPSQAKHARSPALYGGIKRRSLTCIPVGRRAAFVDVLCPFRATWEVANLPLEVSIPRGIWADEMESKDFVSRSSAYDLLRDVAGDWDAGGK